MTKRRSRPVVVRYLPTVRYSDELYHHGVDNQQWGVRHGPPYPLDPSPAKQAVRKKKHVGFFQRMKNKKKGKQLREAKEKKKQETEAKERLINSGDAKLVDKYKNSLSNDEMARAIDRISLSQSISTLKDVEYARKGKKVLDTLSTMAISTANIAVKVADTKDALTRLGIISKKESPLDILSKNEAISDLNAKISKHTLDTANNNEALRQLEAQRKLNDLKNKEDIRQFGAQKTLNDLKNASDYSKFRADATKNRLDITNNLENIRQTEARRKVNDIKNASDYSGFRSKITENRVNVKKNLEKSRRMDSGDFS